MPLARAYTAHWLDPDERLLAGVLAVDGGRGAPGRTGDDGVPVSVVTLLTLGGVAVGAAATLGLRRVGRLQPA